MATKKPIKNNKIKTLPRKNAHQMRAKNTVDSILKATTHILEKFGPDKINTNLIAEIAGVSIGSLYQYFPSKDSIINLLINQFIEYLKKRIDEILTKQKYGNIDDLIEAIVKLIFENFKSNNKIQQLVFQNLFSLKQFEKVKELDTYTLKLIDKMIEPFHDQLRLENKELSLFLIYHSVRSLPLAISLHGRNNNEQEMAKKEIIYLVKRYMMK